MAVIQCKECGYQVSTKADACPGCGAKQRKPAGCLTLMLIGVGTFFAVPVLIFLTRTESDAIQTVDAQESRADVAPQTVREPAEARSATTEASPDVKGRTYTPKKLKAMVAAGKYPPQAAPTTQSEVLEFSACVQKTRAVVAAIGSNYPSQIVVDTAILRMQKIWTNDAAVTITCSAADRTIVFTTAKYL